MATLVTTTVDVGGILPDDWGQLVLRPVEAQSLAFDPDVSTVVATESTRFHLPIVVDDAGASWLTEGQEIDPDAPEIRQWICDPAKVGGLSIVSRELALDSTPAAQQVVGDGLARSIVKQVDAAFFGDMAAPAAPGIEAAPAGAGRADVDAAGYTNLDPFAEAMSAVEQAGGTVTAFVTDPATALALAWIKTGADRNAPLLGVDATNGTARQIFGVPVKVSPAVTPGVVWALDKTAVFTVRRQAVELAVSTDAYFSSDRVGLRATMRVGFAFPAPARTARIAAA